MPPQKAEESGDGLGGGLIFWRGGLRGGVEEEEPESPQSPSPPEIPSLWRSRRSPPSGSECRRHKVGTEYRGNRMCKVLK